MLCFDRPCKRFATESGFLFLVFFVSFAEKKLTSVGEHSEIFYEAFEILRIVTRKELGKGFSFQSLLFN